IQETRDALRAEAARRDVALDPALLEDGVILTRLVAERAIYGVDRDPSAVALSRANLSMRAFAVGMPFPRLTAHLRLGDSLRGTRLQDIKDLGLDSFTAFSGFTDAARAAKMSEPGDLLDGPPTLASYEVLCDLIASRDVGPGAHRDLAQGLGERVAAALRGDAPLTEEEAESLLARAAELRNRYHFVHWDLAFPEVFLGVPEEDVEQPGFDVILGSPPVAAPERAARASEAEDSAHTPMDATIARPFLDLSRELLRQPDGRIAFVLTPSLPEVRSSSGAVAGRSAGRSAHSGEAGARGEGS
ncbi:MAG: Eco57I restriction-modification methylase domain-containing protein, partial [Armatimonadota bacterium]